MLGFILLKMDEALGGVGSGGSVQKPIGFEMSRPEKTLHVKQ